MIVEPGFALDYNGEEIEVPSVAATILPSQSRFIYVILRHAERSTHAQPVAGDRLEFSRTEEGYSIRLETSPTDTGITLARLLRVRGSWRQDAGFQPARLAGLPVLASNFHKAEKGW